MNNSTMKKNCPKLTTEQRQRAVILFESGEYTVAELAKEFRIAHTGMSKLLSREMSKRYDLDKPQEYEMGEHIPPLRNDSLLNYLPHEIVEVCLTDLSFSEKLRALNL